MLPVHVITLVALASPPFAEDGRSSPRSSFTVPLVAGKARPGDSRPWPPIVRTRRERPRSPHRDDEGGGVALQWGDEGGEVVTCHGHVFFADGLAAAGRLDAAPPAGARPATHPPRMVSKVALEADEQFALEVENPSAAPLRAMPHAELVLTPEPRAEIQRPYAPSLSYHAPLGLSGEAAVAGKDDTPLEVPASSTRAWRGRLSSLSWHKKDSGVRLGARPFRQVVPEGRYKLTFWVDGWRSNEVDVVVERGRVVPYEAVE